MKTTDPVPNMTISPADCLTVWFPVWEPDACDRFMSRLAEFGLPARVMRELRPDGSGTMDGVILVSADRRPLRADLVRGVVVWTELDLTDVISALAAAVGGTVWFDDVEFDDAGPVELPTTAGEVPEREEECAPVLVRNLVWHSPYGGEFAGIVARGAGQPLHMQRKGRAAIFAPTGSADDAFAGGAWAANGSTAFWRRVQGRAAAIGVKGEVYVHHWDHTWQVVDPAPHGRDDAGMRVVDYLNSLDDADDDAGRWTAALNLEPGQAQELRILFRSDASDDDTFTRLTGILSVPSELAGIADGRIEPSDLPGATVAVPSSAWAAFRAGIREEFAPADPGQVQRTGWAGHRYRRSPLYLAVMTVGIVVLTSIGLVKLAAGDVDTIWLQAVLIALYGTDLALPRRSKV